jgi:hypothetical protein
LALGEIARPDGREQHVVLQPAQQTLECQDFDPRGGQLERERQGIEATANRGDGASIRGGEAKVGLDVANPFDEEARPNTPALPAREAERGW